jgi:hypothetical protein
LACSFHQQKLVRCAEWRNNWNVIQDYFTGPNIGELRRGYEGGTRSASQYRCECNRSDGAEELADPTHLAAPNREVDSIYYKILGLLPKDDKQRSFQAEALSIPKEI